MALQELARKKDLHLKVTRNLAADRAADQKLQDYLFGCPAVERPRKFTSGRQRREIPVFQRTA